ncbi:MAG: recombinase family protein [Lachnospiraceae bacterium]|nr:recombinase family protein [Lachnospiraceae bacterium]
MDLLRAVIYCRCSTEEESQVDALHKQVQESEACVKEQGWFLVDRYIESKSGTTTRGRNQYQRLFEDLAQNKFDIIVIKSQDRLMRNVKDWYLFLDRMLSHGKRLYMYIEHKFYTTDDALITGIKAILAEEYSRELSKKLNNSHHNRQRNGGRVMLSSRAFGFSKNPDGTVSVVKDEAEIIRKIYEYCAAGYGCRTIANIFLNQGYRKRTGNALSASFISKVIHNPLYKGTMIMNRRHYDFDTKRTLKVPEDQWIYGEGIVPAIVEPELWERANRRIADRAAHFNRNGVYKKGSSAGRYDLSGKLVCSQCGMPYYRTWRHGYADKDSIVIEWKCSSYLEKGRKKGRRFDQFRKVEKEFEDGCDNVHLDETIVFSLLEQVSSQYYNFSNQDKDSIVSHTIQILRKALGETPVEQEWEKLEEEESRLIKQKDFLLTKFLEGVISDKDYRKKDDQLEQKISELQVKKDQLKQKEWEIRNLEQRIEQIKSRLEAGGIEKATVSQMLQDIREIKVCGWYLEICFDPMRIVHLSGSRREEKELMQELLSKDFSIRVDYPFAPETERGRYLDRRRIVSLMKENPAITAKQIAQKMERSPYMVRKRIEELNKAKYICFNGRGGHGTWEILRELPDKETSIEAGDL